MNLKQFLDRVIDDGIKAAKEDYGPKLPDSHYKQRLEGSIAGFEACRDKTPEELRELLDATNTATQHAYFEDNKEQYWWYRCYQAEVEWVCNVLSSVLHNEGLPTIIIPTCRGMMKAAEIVGVKDEN